MFVAIMQVLHNTLPCTKNFFQLRQKYQATQGQGDRSPVQAIASPTFIRDFGYNFSRRKNSGLSPLPSEASQAQIS